MTSILLYLLQGTNQRLQCISQAPYLSIWPSGLLLLVGVLAILQAYLPLYAQSDDLVISQLYGGGGNSGATLHSDFIEVFNRGNAPVNVGGHSVQYASSSGTSWQVTLLGEQTIPAGGYLLIKQASGASGSDNGTDLSFPDVTATTAMSASSGKVALVVNSEPISGIDDPDVLDFVGYGSADQAEGGNPGQGLSATTALLRLENGCTDTDKNGMDLIAGSPMPRSSNSPLAICQTNPENPTSTATETFTLTSTETPVPTSTETLTPTPTETPLPTSTETPLPTPTETPLPTPTETPLPTPTETPLPTPTETPLPTPTETPLPTPTETPLPTPTSTETLIPTSTETLTETPVPTSTETGIPTSTASQPTATTLPTHTPTATLTVVPTIVDTPTVTDVPTATDTFIPPPSPTSTQIPTRTSVPTATALPTVTPTNTTLPTIPPTQPPSSTTTPTQTEIPSLPSATATEASVSTATVVVLLTSDGTNQAGEPSAEPSPTDTLTPIPTVTETSTLVPLVPGTPTPIIAEASSVSQLWITEIMMNPGVVSDTLGEWIELYNPNSFPVDLLNWVLADDGSDYHIIETSLIIQPGSYVVLARNGDSSLNGNVAAAYEYSNMKLSNSMDEVWLLAPDWTLVDQVNWHEELSIPLPTGSTLERVNLGEPESWQIATELWSDSVGDLGSPGSANSYLTPIEATRQSDLQELTASPMATLVNAEQVEPTSTRVVEIERTEPASVDSTLTDSTPTVSTPVDYRDSDGSNESLDTQHQTATPSATESGTTEPLSEATGPGTLTPANTPTTMPTTVPTTATTTVPTSTPVVTRPTPTPLPIVIISEIMVNPKAVSDSAGEYIELWLASADPVNLKGWRIGDLDTENYLISEDLWIVPATSLLLARNDDPSQNGGIEPDNIYSGISLANGSDELILYRPNGEEADRVAWGQSVDLIPQAGISLEQTARSPNGRWVNATSAWSGSSGDWGSPGVVNHALTLASFTFIPLVVGNHSDAETTGADGINAESIAFSNATSPTLTMANVTPTSTTYTPQPSAVVSPTSTAQANPTVSPTPVASATGTIGAQTPDSTNVPTSRALAFDGSGLFISEVMANPKAVSDSHGEYIEICNESNSAINLEGWILADLDSEQHEISGEQWVPTDECILMGRNANMSQNGGISIDYTYSGINLSNTADELLLISLGGEEVDRLVWAPDSVISVTAGASLEQVMIDSRHVWRTAGSPWSSSQGDFGSPGFRAAEQALVATSTTQINGTVTDQRQATTQATVQAADGFRLQAISPTAIEDAISTATSNTVATRSPSPSVSLTPTPWDVLLEPLDVDKRTKGNVADTSVLNGTPTATSPSEKQQNPVLVISEFLADSSAVADHMGEWIEITNVSSIRVNLRGWSLSDEGEEHHLIAGDLIVEPEQAILLARQQDPILNGGVLPNYIYTGVNLANSADELILSGPDGQIVDWIQWDKNNTLLNPGRSTERIVSEAGTEWRITDSLWIGSSGDSGTPGLPHPSLIVNGLNKIADDTYKQLMSSRSFQGNSKGTSDEIRSEEDDSNPDSVTSVNIEGSSIRSETPTQSPTTLSTQGPTSTPDLIVTKALNQADSVADSLVVSKLATIEQTLQELKGQIPRGKSSDESTSISKEIDLQQMRATLLRDEEGEMIISLHSMPETQLCIHDGSERTQVGSEDILLCGQMGLYGGETTFFVEKVVRPRAINQLANTEDTPPPWGVLQHFRDPVILVTTGFLIMVVMNLGLVLVLLYRRNH